MRGVSLLLFPGPGIGHIVSTVRLAQQLVSHHHRISIYILLMKLPVESEYSSYLQSLSVPSPIKLLQLPLVYSSLEDAPAKDGAAFFFAFVEAHVPHVRAAAKELSGSPDVPPLAGFVVDMFCTCMIEVAEEFNVPSYIFFTSSAAFLGLFLHLQALHDESGVVLGHEDDNLEAELRIPSFVNPMPVKLVPSVLMGKTEEMAEFIGFARSFRKGKAIMVNTCKELESYPLEALKNSIPGCPPVYAVGPLLSTPPVEGERSEVSRWLDQHPESSVVFLCFGSYGWFPVEQVREIGLGLERSGCRFLWSLRRPPEGKLHPPHDYSDPAEVLPHGFMERTAGIGRVIGWAPQIEVLAHKAIGGFVSHCGWNSTLESLCFGVPMATWPLYAEQQMNAFQLVREMRAAVEIAMDYHKDGNMILAAEQVEKGIRKLMDTDNEVRSRVKQMGVICTAAVAEGGSSHSSLSEFIELIVG